MVERVLASQTRNPEDLDGAQRAFDRALKKAFLTGQAYDPDGTGYAYWKAKDDAEKLSESVSPPNPEN